METLEKTLRNRLERTIREARAIAEDAARVALEQLGVGEAAAFPHMKASERELRLKLREHGRQLGDTFNAKNKTQEIGRLIEEVAYAHWHRMLFARFLADNNLLMYWTQDEEPIDIDLETCQGLIDEGEEHAGSKWELAARFAARMLPQIFRSDSPVFGLVLPPEHQQKLEQVLSELPREVFTASDSLGWVYQFWQAKQKEEVNASEVKIDARELPAVTQLFTEPYMVSFLLDNSLGAWWAARRLSYADLKNTKSEDELRRKASLPGVPLDYLRFVKTLPLNPVFMDGEVITSPINLVFKNGERTTSPLNPLSINGERTCNVGEGICKKDTWRSPVVGRNFVSPEKLEETKRFRKEPTKKEAEVWNWLRGRRSTHA